LNYGIGTSCFLSPTLAPIHPVVFLVFSTRSGSLLVLVYIYSSLSCWAVFYKGAKLMLAVGFELTKTGVSLTCIGMFEINPAV